MPTDFINQAAPYFNSYPDRLMDIYQFLYNQMVIKLLITGHHQAYKEVEAALFLLLHEWPDGLRAIKFGCSDPVKGVMAHIRHVLDFLLKDELVDKTHPDSEVSYVSCRDSEGSEWPLEQSGLWGLMINDDYRKILNNIPGYSPVEPPLLTDNYRQDRDAVAQYYEKLRAGVTRVFDSFACFVRQALDPGILGGDNLSEDYCRESWETYKKIQELISRMQKKSRTILSLGYL